MHRSVEIHQTNRLDYIEYRSAHGPGIHAQGAAHGTGYSLQEFQAGQAVSFGLNGDCFESGAGAAAQERVRHLNSAELRLGQANHYTTKPTVLYQQIRAPPQNQKGPAEETAEV